MGRNGKKGGRFFNMAGNAGISADLLALCLPQAEQLGIRLERRGWFWAGAATGTVAKGTMWFSSPSPGCLVLYHDVVPRADMRLREESRGPYACACMLKDAALACSQSCGLALRPAGERHGAEHTELATFVEREPRTLTSPLHTGQRYRSSSIILLPEFFAGLERSYPGEFRDMPGLFDTHLGARAGWEIGHALSRISSRPPTGSGGALALRAAVDGLMASLAAGRDASTRDEEGAAELVRQAKDLVAQALDEGAAPPTVDGLAKALYVSRSRLCAAFQRETAQSPGLYVRRTRIERACELLGNRDLTVADVAARLGYPGLSAFDHAFTRATGLSPHAWRTQRKCASPQPRTP